MDKCSCKIEGEYIIEECWKCKYDDLKAGAEYTIRDLELRLRITQKQRESLKRDKAALIEVLEWYGDAANNEWWEDMFNKVYASEVMGDAGERARTILAKMKEPQ